MPRFVLGIWGKAVIRCCPVLAIEIVLMTWSPVIVVVAGNAPPIDITVYSKPQTTLPFVLLGVPVVVVQCTCGPRGVPIL